MIFRKHDGGNWYGNFLRHTFDKVREVTRRVRIVWLLLPLLQLFGNSRVRSFFPRRYEDRIACEISFPRWDAIKTAPCDRRRTQYIFPSRRRGCYPPTRNFSHYVNLRAKWTTRTKQHAREGNSKFGNARMPVIVRQS